MNHNIGTVILATTDDIQFLHEIIKQSLIFSSQIIISFGSHFYNNEPENNIIINDLIKQYSLYDNIIIIRYNIPDDYIKNTNVSLSNYWHCHGRWCAIQQLKNNIEYVLLLDADEIPEGKQFLNWLNDNEYKNFDCMKLANYWYFREPIYRAKNIIEDSIVFIKKTHADNISLTMHTHERTATYDLCPGNKRRNILINNCPIFHHFSWVRTHKQMLRKVTSWGHRNDKDYISLVNEEFLQKFRGYDNIFRYTYDIVPNLFNITLTC